MREKSIEIGSYARHPLRSSYFPRMKYAWLLLFVLLLIGCSSPSGQRERAIRHDADNETTTVQKPSVKDTSLRYDLGDYEATVQIQMPQGDFRGTILVLQGWNFSHTDWCDSSDLCAIASEQGYCLVMPAMGKSIFHKQVYPQTRESWRKYPTRTWLVDTLIPALQQEYNLFLPEQLNFVMGLSTGGRGAFMIAQENPDVFAAGASLSGDYDQAAFPDDNLYRGYFGIKPDAWDPSENPVSFARNWSVPMFIAHGGKDTIVSVKHLMRLREVQERVQPDLNFQFHVDDSAGHDYNFWGREVKSILDFFDHHMSHSSE